MSIQLIEENVGQRAVDSFHRQLYSLHEDDYPHWMGTLIRKNPLDLWMYAEIIQHVKPDVIIECGTAKGGSARFFAHMQWLASSVTGKKSARRVITIDEKEEPIALRGISGIQHIQGKTQDPNVHARVIAAARLGTSVLVSLDAGHLTHEVLAELELYAPLVTLNSYCVVEDTNIEGRPLGHEGVNGPGKAVARFLETECGRDFEVDLTCERFGLTFNPGGWLKRVR